MKYFFLLLLGASLTACNMTDKKETPQQKEAREAQEKKNEAAMKDTASFTTIQWLDSTTQDLGTITKGTVAEITWKFKNIGSTPLIIENVHPTCGCTVAEKPSAPISPGEQGVIKAKYSSDGGNGHVEKHMTVSANIKNNNSDNVTSIGFTANVKE